MSKILSLLGAIGMAVALLVLPLDWVEARGGGRGGGRNSGGSGMGRSGGGRASKGKGGKTAKRDRERAAYENRDAFKRDAADDAA